jgi:HipA-like protein
MTLDVHASSRRVAKLYRERDEYVLKYLPDTAPEDFISLTMPVREEAWRWPRDLFPFFRQNLPEGYLLGVIREEFGPLLDGTDLSLLGVVGGTGIGRVSVTPEGIQPGVEMAPLEISHLLKAENTSERFAALVSAIRSGSSVGGRTKVHCHRRRRTSGAARHTDPAHRLSHHQRLRRNDPFSRLQRVLHHARTGAAECRTSRNLSHV